LTHRRATSLIAFGERVDPRRLAWVLFGSIGIMALVGILTEVAAPGNPWSDLDSEIHLQLPLTASTIAFPALWSGLILLGAALFWWGVAARATIRVDRVLAGSFGSFMVLMALDELVTIHEHLQYWTHIDWMELYAPLVLLMGLATLALMVRLWPMDRTATLLMIGGGAAWAFAQFLELIQWDGDLAAEHKVPAYVLLMIPEELLEASGSALFCLAGARAIRAIRAGERRQRTPDRQLHGSLADLGRSGGPIDLTSVRAGHSRLRWVRPIATRAQGQQDHHRTDRTERHDDDQMSEDGDGEPVLSGHPYRGADRDDRQLESPHVGRG
jgi:hypothetical protein